MGEVVAIALAAVVLGLLAGALLMRHGWRHRQASPGPTKGDHDRRRLAAIVDSSSDAIIGMALDGVITSWNRAAERLYGYSAAEVLGQRVQLLIPPERVEEERRMLAELTQGQAVPPFETVRRARDGRLLTVSISVSAILDEAGRVEGCAKIVRDLSSHRQVESQLRESRAVLDGALRDNESLLRTLHTHFIVSIADAAGTITEVNDRFCHISGYSRDELIGQNHRIINSGVQPPAFWQQLWRTISAGQAWRGEICNRARDGSLYWVDSVISPFVDAEGRVQKYISIRTDITAAKQAEGARLEAERLEAENRQILEANRLKSLFLANMSHELRTPLNAVIGFADLLRTRAVDPASPRHDQFLGHIASSGRHLLQLINDVLDLSKVESGKLDFFAEPLELQPVVADVVAVLAQAWERKAITVEVDIDPTLGPLELDPARLRQVLFNYLSNAIKFTPEGGRVVVRARGEGPLHFRLEVQDNGPGIAAADLPRLFVEFQQLDGGYSKQHAGTGLGLALTRRLVRAQGGNVGVRSTPGVGSSFHLVLPRHAAGGDAGRTQLLMIEASPRLHARLAEPLAEAGFAVDLAADAPGAARLAGSRPYDAITLDVLLQGPGEPGPGGLGTVSGIRSDGPSRSTPVVAVTMSDPQNEAAFAIADVLAKPIRVAEVVSAMARLRPSEPGRRRVLVVDDDPAACELMRATLEAMDIDVSTAPGGAPALEQLSRGLPDAVVLDLMMPGMDGFEVLARLQGHPTWSRLPVFIWTSLILTDEEHATLARSARAVLAKGDGQLDAVLQALRRWQPMPMVSGDLEPR